MGGGFARVVKTVFDRDEDPEAKYKRVRESLTLGTRASSASYGQFVDALDQAEDLAAEAMELLVDAKVTLDAFEIDAKILLSALRDQATAVLQHEKETGLRSKQITDADVESTMAAKHPDEWRALEEKRGKAKRTVALLEDLCDRCRARAGHLRAMTQGARRD